MNQAKRIAILGSTGSIGTQALEVIASHPGLFTCIALTAGNNARLLIRQAFEFKPSRVVIGDPSKYQEVREALKDLSCEVFAGPEAINDVACMEEVDLVLAAMVGYAGLQPALKALMKGKNLALANKETLVVAGELVTRIARERQALLIPVDSEHSAIFQCLVGEDPGAVEKVILTASGGPFRGFSREQLEAVSIKQALQHPNWEMGDKITIDSATLMNKGLEAIEAKWLFNLFPDQIDVVIHPQSIIHSMVQFRDSSMKAQMGLPDMRIPIQYALGYPERLPGRWPRFNFADFPALTFEAPDTARFPNLRIALDVMRQGGNLACIMNAANEIAVEAFLNEKIGFTGITHLIEKTLGKATFMPHPGYEEYIESDREARRLAVSFIK